MPIIAIDTETRGLDCTKFVMGSVYDGKKCESFWDREKMARYLLSVIKFNAKIGKKTRIYAHNMEYDFYTVFQDMWREFRIVSYPNPFIAVYETKGWVHDRKTGQMKRIIGTFGNFHSTTDIFPMSLARLGMITGREKKEIPEGLLEGDKGFDWQEMSKIREYCENDTRIVYDSLKWLKDMIQEEFGSTPKRMITSGQIAMSTYMSWIRKNHPNEEEGGTYWEKMAEWNEPEKKWQIPKTRYDKAIRVAYRGGNNTAFQKGIFENATMIDVNSLYPYIMATMRFPDLKREEYIEEPTKEMLKDIGFTRARVKITGKGGMLPIRYMGRMMMPEKKGLSMESIWSNWELREAIKDGYEIEEMRTMISYPDLDVNPFTEYIGKLYRMKGEEGKKETAKILMNALSGKFGQRRVKKKLEFIHRRDVLAYARDGWNISGDMGEYYAISKQTEGYDSYFVNPAIIATITAGARIFLWGEMKKIKERDLLYCDTDSIIARDFGKYEKRFEMGEELGQWRKEFENERIEIKGEKKYASDSRIKMSGAGRRYITRDNFNEGKIEQKKMVGIEEAIRAKRGVGEFRNEVMIIQNTSKRDMEIPNRVVVDLW